MSLFGRQEADRAAFYHSLRTPLQSGLSLSQALDLARGGGRRLDRALEDAQHGLSQGATLAEALASDDALPPEEIALLDAGERSGHLPEALESLAMSLERRGRTLGALHSKLVYPAVLLHLAILLPTLGTLVSEGTGAYLSEIAGPFAALYGVFGLAWAAKAALRRAPRPRRAVERVLRAVPVLGGHLRDDPSARFAELLGLLLGAGLGAAESLDLAARACGSALLEAAVREGAEIVRLERVSISEALTGAEPLLPPLLVRSIRTGESSGKLDEVLTRSARAIDERAEMRLAVVVRLLPVAVFLVVALVVGLQIVRSYQAQNAVLDDLLR